MSFSCLASDQASRNAFLCQRHANATPVTVIMSQQDKVEELIKGVDVVIRYVCDSS